MGEGTPELSRRSSGVPSPAASACGCGHARDASSPRRACGERDRVRGVDLVMLAPMRIRYQRPKSAACVFPACSVAASSVWHSAGRSETSTGFAGGGGFVGFRGFARSRLNQSSSSFPQPSSPAGGVDRARRAARRQLKRMWKWSSSLYHGLIFCSQALSVPAARRAPSSRRDARKSAPPPDKTPRGAAA